MDLLAKEGNFVLPVAASASQAWQGDSTVQPSGWPNEAGTLVWWRHALRAGLELLIAYVVVHVLTLAVMNAMFWFGPWANPPGVNEGYVVLMVVATVLCGWRA